MITQIQVSRIDYIKIKSNERVVLTNVLLPGDISIDNFALALAGNGGWLQCFKQLWECRYHSLLWSMYTCSFIVHISSFRIALLVMHRRTSFFFGVLVAADSQGFCLIALFVLDFMPRVPIWKKQIIGICRKNKRAKWMIHMRMLANLCVLYHNSCVALPFRQQH